VVFVGGAMRLGGA